MARRFIFALTCFLTATAAFNVSTLTFDEGYAPLFGDGNVVKSADGKSVSLMLDRSSGSGFISSELYSHGFFSAKIKLPSDYTAGVVVAFYTSNGDIFEKTHDELDFEFLGNIKGKEWRVQTNVYGDGSTNIGREERYLLPFDPTKEAHRYSILWTAENIIFYIDQTPIRDIRRTAAMGSHYPSKPMSLYATIWDASSWATNGGKYGVDYSYAPFIAEFSDLALAGCATGPIQDAPSRAACESAHTELSTADFAVMTPAKRAAMRRFRERYMTYSICYDEVRYPVKLPDCEVVPSEQRRFWHTGDARFQRVHRRRQGRSRAAVVAKGGANEDV